MELVLGKFILLYLLLPLLGIILGAIMFVIAKKNNLLSNKKIIFYFLITCIILALPALLGFIDYWFMPYVYIALMVIYLLLGYWNKLIIKKLIKDIDDKPYYVEFLIVFVITFIAAGLFSLIFNLSNELQYGIWACTCVLPFIFSTLFFKMYKSYMEIPLEVYKIWSYDTQEDFLDSEHFNYDKILVVELELFKQVSDYEPLNIKAKASEEIPFGVWFKVFINDYNKKSPQSPIIYTDYQNSYGWIFYTYTSILGRKKYIDPDLSFAKNNIKEKNSIIAKRTQYEELEN